MRIDDDVARSIRRVVARSGRSFNAVVNDALRAGISGDRVLARARAYHLEPVAMGDVVGPYDLNKTLQLADDLEDQRIARELEIRK